MKKLLFSLVLSVILIQFVSATLTDPTTYWKFNEDSGNASDFAGSIKLHQNGGVVSGYIPGKLSNAIHLNVSSGEVIMNASGNTLFAFGTGVFSIAYWINGSAPLSGSHTAMGTANSAGSWAIISDTAGAEHEWQEGSGRVLGTINPVANGLWHRVVWVREGTGSNQFKVYVDNVNVQNATLATDITDTTNPFSIHAPNIAPVSYDDLRIYKGYALTVAEISTDWNSGSGQELGLAPEVTLRHPTTNSFLINSSIYFNSTQTSSTGGNLTNATINIWYTNGTLFNQTTVSQNGTSNESIFNISSLSIGKFKWNVLACASNSSTTACSFALTNLTFNYGFRKDSEIFTTPVTETQESTFYLNITTSSSAVVSSAKLHYNNTANLVTPSLISGTSYSLKKSVVAPLVSSSSTNINFHWEIIFSDGTSQNTTSQQQVVQNSSSIVVGTTCGAGRNAAITFNFKDENLTSINSSTEYNIRYGYNENSTNLVVSGNLTNINAFSVCVNSTTSQTLTGNSQVMYGDGSFVERTFFVFDGVTLSNTTTVNHTLYNLGTTDATSFLLTVRDSSLTALNDKYVSLMRWYPSLDEYRVVEMGRTDEDGQTVLKVIVEDVDYKFSIHYKNGSLIKLTEPLRMVCLVNPCELTVTVAEAQNFVSFLEVEHTLTFNNNTNIVTFTWNDPNQLTTLMNLTVYKLGSTTDTVVCESTGTGFIGTILCDVTGQTGNLKVVVVRSASPGIPIASLFIDGAAKIIDIAGGKSIGLFIGFITVTFVILGGLVNPVLGVLMAIIGLIPAYFFGAISTTVLLAVATMGVIVIWFMRK